MISKQGGEFCSAISCTNARNIKNTSCAGKSFFKFPKDEESVNFLVGLHDRLTWSYKVFATTTTTTTTTTTNSNNNNTTTLLLIIIITVTTTTRITIITIIR